MKLAASQIGWEPQLQDEVLDVLLDNGFTGLEIAPSIAVGDAPYTKLAAAGAFGRQMAARGLAVCSMQSIWYGQSGSMFGPEREALLEYTRQAILFAEAVGAKNLVFGCPKNRVVPEGETADSAIDFFKGLGEFAEEHGAVLALEANPPVYGTNFMNTTGEALSVVERVHSPGCMLNLDVGTMLTNGEDVKALRGQVHRIHHVHISEPALAAIEKRGGHHQLAALLRQEGYSGWVSVETSRQPLAVWQKTAAYVAEVFA